MTQIDLLVNWCYDDQVFKMITRKYLPLYNGTLNSKKCILLNFALPFRGQKTI